MRRCELTGLRTQSALLQELGGAGRVGVFVDIDGLSWINAEQGFLVGDGVVQVVGRLLDGVATCAGGTAYRVAGDEFVVLMPTGTSLEAATWAARQCARLVAQRRIPGNPQRATAAQQVAVNAVAGPVWAPLAALREERAADIWLAKRGQRDTVGVVAVHHP